MENFEIELKITILGELEDTLNELYSLLSNCPIDELDIDAIFRAAHSIKGNSKAAEFNSMAKVTHLIEDFLIKEKKQSSIISEAMYELLLCFTENLQTSIEQLRNDIERELSFDTLKGAIDSYISKLNIESSAETIPLKKLLLIDDDIDIYNSVKMYLSTSFEIDYVSSAVQAIEDCKLELYDLIICDYKMPIMNGQEFVLYLRQGSSKNKLTNVIFLTAFSPNLFNQKSIWENVLFMHKPIDKKKLLYYVKCATQKEEVILKVS